MAPIELHGMPMSAPCRIVAMAAELAEAEYAYVDVNPIKGDTRKPEFLAINPTHTIPTIKDGETIVYESRACAAYIMNKHCKNAAFNPQDAETKAQVDMRMYFDMGIFYKAVGECVYPLLFKGVPTTDEAKDKLKEALGFLENYVADDKFAAGTEGITLADLPLVATYSTIKPTEVIDFSAYPNVEAWFEKCIAAIPNYEKANGEGAEAFAAFYKSKL